MGPNEAEMVRVFTREVGALVRSEALPHDQSFEIVAEVATGATLLDGGPQYETGIVVRDLTGNTTIPTRPAGYGPEYMGGPDWDSQTAEFVYSVSDEDLVPSMANHCFEAIAFLKVGAPYPVVSFAQSPLFMLTD